MNIPKELREVQLSFAVLSLHLNWEQEMPSMMDGF